MADTPQQTLEAQLETDLTLFGKIASAITVDAADPLNIIINIPGDIALAMEIYQAVAAISATIKDFKAAA